MRTTTSKRQRITATDAAKNFGEVIDRVRHGGATFIVERNGRPVAEIRPVAASQVATLKDFAEAVRTGPKLDEETLRYIEQHVARLNRPSIPASPWER